MFNFKKEKEAPENIEEILERFSEIKKKMEGMEKEMEEIRKENLTSLQRFSVVRFNPFSDMGGSQSFCAAFLNKEGSGIVITSLYSREGNRVYGKLIHKGNSEHALSEEEKKAVEEANKQNEQ